MSKKTTKKTKESKDRNHPASRQEAPPQALIQKQQTYTGPIPPPSILADFEKICPGMADRIMTLAEKDAEHVRKYNETHLLLAKDHQRDERHATCRGQWMSFILMLSFILCGFILIILDKKITGTIFGSVAMIGALGSLVYSFINIRKSKIKKD